MISVGRGSALATVVLGISAAVSVSPAMAQAASAAGSSSHLYLIQGVPGSSVDISIDGKSIDSGVKTKSVVGPIDVGAGKHMVTFSSSDWTIKSSFTADHPSMDVVLHWPADVTDKPEVTVFNNDVQPVASGKGRLTVAHTAVVPPADVRVDKKVLFSNIANGEFVSAVVPAGTYSVDIVPTGQSGHPLLGPVDLPVKAGVLTRVFAIGEPTNGSMDAIVQVIAVASAGSPAPGSVDAGEAGLVAPQASSGPMITAPVALGLAALTALALGAAGLKRERVRR